jgi:hypothetical protein
MTLVSWIWFLGGSGRGADWAESQEESDVIEADDDGRFVKNQTMK